MLTCCLSRKTEALSLVELTFDLPDIVLSITCNYKIVFDENFDNHYDYNKFVNGTWCVDGVTWWLVSPRAAGGRTQT